MQRFEQKDFEEIEQKKSYVYQNILEADYEAEDFAEYLATQPPKYTANLAQIPFANLKQIVQRFIELNKLPEYNQIELQKSQSTPRLQSDNNLNNVNNNNNNYNRQKFYMKSTSCVKGENKFALTNIKVDIISFKKNEGRFLSRDYILYKIELPQLHKQIDRRYSDFQWLRNLLVHDHPGLSVPPLPKKKMKKIFTIQHVKKKGRMLECFLRKCLQIPDIRCDQTLYRFLITDHYEKFEEYKKHNKIEKNIVSMQKIKTASGRIEYGINEDCLNINQKGNTYFTNSSPIMKSIYKQIKRIKQNLQSCAGHFFNLEQLTKKMSLHENEFKKFTLQGQERNFYDYLNILAINYKDQMKNMCEIWEKEIYFKLKYEYHHSEMFEEDIKLYKVLQKQFESKKQQIQKKKMKIYSKPIAEWDLNPEIKQKFESVRPSFQQASPYLLIRKTQQLNKIELKYALYTKQLANSIQFYRMNNNKHDLKNFQSFLSKQYESQSKWTKKLKQMIGKQFDMKFCLVSQSIFQSKEIINSNRGQSNPMSKFSITENNRQSNLSSMQQMGSVKEFFSQYKKQKTKESRVSLNLES